MYSDVLIIVNFENKENRVDVTERKVLGVRRPGSAPGFVTRPCVSSQWPCDVLGYQFHHFETK